MKFGKAYLNVRS